MRALRLGILGGSFNPVHIGHLRLALEAGEALRLERTDLLPCAVPPHKSVRGLLPFDLRVRLLRAAVRGLPGLRVNPLEGRRSGPSYTWNSLLHYARGQRGAKLFFILGCGDFAALPSWHRGPELLSLADFVVVPRAGEEKKRFLDAVRHILPAATPCVSPPPALAAAGATAFDLPTGARLFYLPVTRLDLSASLVRRRFVSGLDLRLLVPAAALRLLEKEREAVTDCWSSASASVR